ncbi:hypothetical protein DJ030_12675 [bacterium endosymbiont of Escarpia laminata]|nr:MAG: hypothetical protein DJ031_12235 [bacterium endosymbiont of Escarpia laminata]RLJ18233.1 MAG: hypothetical protein DJ030_12675 [bacterium endosymbiont of Escarpia laminata]
MAFVFNESKTTQLAAYFLQKSKGEMFLLKLMKLLYIADRESFRRYGHPISYDNFVSMDHGPVLSRTYSLMNGMVLDTSGEWNSMISPRNGHKISIVDESEVSFDELSDAEMEIADAVFVEYGHIPRFRLAEITHSFSEWKNPDSSSLRISYMDILKALGYKDGEIQQSIQHMQHQQAVDDFFEVA